MIIDCHFHFDPRMLSIEQLIQKMDQSQIDKIALIPPLTDPIPDLPKILLELLQWLLKRKTFRPLGRLLCSNFTKQGDIQILLKSYPIYKEPDNATLFDTIDRFPDRFLGWILIHPKSQQDSIAEVHRWIDHPNCVGIKAHPFWHQYAPAELIPVAEIASAKGKPMLIHLGFDDHGDYQRLVQTVPELKLILAHAAFPEYKDQWKSIRSLPNVFVDISQTAYVNIQTIAEVINYLGPEKCLYGSDGPYGSEGQDGLFDFDVILKQIKQTFPDLSVQEAIMGKNFQRLIGMA
ncbi:MAG: amidohydrolase [Candidatus Magnetomorum sp.]|nr:amidohydrolase [Candidatus Magnetomorum sp.]